MNRLTVKEREHKHIENLSKIMNCNFIDAKAAYHEMRKIQHTGSKLAVDYCNGDIDSEQYEAKTEPLLLRFKALLPAELAKNSFFNSDPRGYFLKINDEYMRKNKLSLESDWGGYGIYCPEFKA